MSSLLIVMRLNGFYMRANINSSAKDFFKKFDRQHSSIQFFANVVDRSGVNLFGSILIT